MLASLVQVSGETVTRSGTELEVKCLCDECGVPVLKRGPLAQDSVFAR